MNYVKTHTRTDGLEVLFTETVSKVDVNNQSITFDGLPPHLSWFMDPTSTTDPIRKGKVISTFTPENDQPRNLIYLVQTDVCTMRLVFSHRIIHLPAQPSKVGDIYTYNSKPYVIAKIYARQMLIELDDDAQLMTRPFVKEIKPDEKLTPETIVYLSRMLKEKGLESQMLAFVNTVNAYKG